MDHSAQSRIAAGGAEGRSPPRVGGTVGFVLKGYPRLSETFIAQEIRALERRGLAIVLFSLRHPTDRKRHPIHDEIAAPVVYLPEYLHDEPTRVFAAWRRVRRRPGFRTALAVWRRDVLRDATPNRVRRWGQAMVLAAEAPTDLIHLHAHFIHTPASVARYASMILGLRWSCSAHAKDIWTSADWEKREKLAACSWAVACTRAAVEHLQALAPPGRVELVYHGLDFERFPPPPPAWSRRNGGDPSLPVRLLAVGRAVAKKGFDVLLDALSGLPPTLAWRLVHLGGGPHLSDLQRAAAAAGLAERIEWRGAAAQEEVLRSYRDADLFVMPSRIAADGDRDGLPNVLMEAQSQGLACIASDVSGIPELIADGRTGTLVPPENPVALRQAIVALIGDPTRRESLGRAAQAHVLAAFRSETGIDRLAVKFGLPG